MQHYTAARTYQVRVQLTRDGHRRLDERLRAHCRLYNAALQERRDAWRMVRRSINYAAQSRELTLVRQDDSEWAGEHRRLAVATLKRVDLAFAAFFRRVKAGETPGFPRFKSWRRYRTLDIYAGADHFLQVNDAGTRATIRIKGLLTMRLQLHRQLPDGQPLTIRITRKPRRVVVSLVYHHENPEPVAVAPEHPVGIDAGRRPAAHPQRRPLCRTTGPGPPQAAPAAAPCLTRETRIGVSPAQGESAGQGVAADRRAKSRRRTPTVGDPGAGLRFHRRRGPADPQHGAVGVRHHRGARVERRGQVGLEPVHLGAIVGFSIRQDRVQGCKRWCSFRQGAPASHVPNLRRVWRSRSVVAPEPGTISLPSLRPPGERRRERREDHPGPGA